MKNMKACAHVLIIIMVGVGGLGATTNYWTGAGGNSHWDNAVNWSDGLPSAGQDVAIIGGADVLLSESTPPLESFTLGNTARLTFEGWDNGLSASTILIEGIVTHLPNDVAPTMDGWVPWHRILLLGTDITVAATGALDADERGYRRNQGPGTPLGATSGAGYGGEGGFGMGRAGGAAYGDPHAPTDPGSGAGVSDSYPTQSGEGGGAIRVIASGNLAVDGRISANGRRYYSTHGGGGSGGGIWLSCHTLSGGGLVQANGGAASYFGGGGSGGRIAVHYDPIAQAALPEPIPPIRFEGVPGSVVANRNLETFRPAMASLSLSDTLLVGENPKGGRLKDVVITIPGWEAWECDTLEIDDCSFGVEAGVPLVVANDLIVTNGAKLHLFAKAVEDLEVPGMTVRVGRDLVIQPSSWILPYCEATNGATVAFIVGRDLYVAEDGGFDAERRGYNRGFGPGTGLIGRPDSGNAAGHGGRGGMGFGGQPWGMPYGSAEWPIAAGSGAWLKDGASYAGRGGGVIRLKVEGGAKIDGLLNADGSPAVREGAGGGGGGGSGGSILLECHTLAGSGRLSASGGQGYSGGGCGGGGRIAVHYDPTAQAELATPVPAVSFSAYAYPETDTGYSSTINAQEGTLWLPDTLFLTERIDRRFWHLRLVIPDFLSWAPASLILDNSFLTWPTGFKLSVVGDLILTNGAGFKIVAAMTNEPMAGYGAEVEIGNDLIIATNCWIFPENHPTNGAVVGFKAGRDVDIAAGGGIDATGAGYLPSPGNTLGPGAGGSTYNSGGGYGGAGGGSQAGASYGDSLLPVWPGSPGGWNGYGGQYFSVSGAGGGTVLLRAGGEVRLDGSLRANGWHGSYYRGSGGSGGSILVAARRLVGKGLLEASGGIGGDDYASGGGGRIAVWQEMDLAAIEARLVSGSVAGLHPLANKTFSGSAVAAWLGESKAGTPGEGSVVFCSGNLFFEAEGFTPSSDGWKVAESSRASGAASLHGASGDKFGTATQQFFITEAGSYTVWLRYIHRPSTRGPFRLSINQDGQEQAAKVFDLYEHPDGVNLDYVWDSFQVFLQPGEYQFVLSKHENQSSSSYVRHVDSILLSLDQPDQPDHRDYGQQTYVRVRMGPGYTTGAYPHIFADHYRSPWYSHHYLSKSGMGNGYAPPAAERMLSGESTPWCNLTTMLYQDSGAILNFTIRHTYATHADHMAAFFEFAYAPNDEAIVRTMDVTANPNGLMIVMPPNLATEENLERFGRDLDFATRTGALADSYDWPSIGRKPERFPFFVAAKIGGYSALPDQEVIDREMATLDYFGFSNWKRTAFHGGMWHRFESSYCRPDTNKIVAAAQTKAQELATAGVNAQEVAYCMLTDEPTGQSLDFMAADSAYQASFRQWIEKQGLEPQDLLVNSWQDVGTVTEADRDTKPALYYYSQKFRTRALGDFIAFQRRALEEACGGSFPVNVNFSDGAVYSANFYSQGVDYFELLDDDGQNSIWGEDWANLSSTYQCGAYNVDLMRAAAGPRSQVIGHYLISYAGRMPFDVKLKAVGNTARGARILKSFSYGVYWGGHEGGPAWQSTAWQNHPEMWGAQAEILREIGAVEDELLDSVAPRAQVAILYSSSSDIWEQDSGNYAYGFERMHTWLALTHAQIPVDFVSEKQAAMGALDGYLVCYLMGPNLQRDAADKVAAWTLSGGRLVVGAGAAMRDEFNRPMDVIEDLSPANRGAVATLQNFRNSGRYLRSLASKGTVDTGDAVVNVLSLRQTLVPKAGSATTGSFNDGAPAWVKGGAGDGRVECLGFLPALDYMRQALLARDQMVERAENLSMGGIDGEDEDSGTPLETVAPEDRWRIENSANPWDYPATVRDAILAPVREAGVDAPIVCDTPLVDAVYLSHRDGILIPLANYTLYPLESIELEVKVARPVAKIESVHHGDIGFSRNGERILFSLPLESSDYIKIIYGRGSVFMLAKKR